MTEGEIKTYSLEEIAAHSTEDSLWLLIDNGVYDVTKFQEEHPGGPEVLLDWGGKEATEAFEDVGHSSDARSQLKQYKIGELHEADRKAKKPPPSSSCLRMRYLLPVGVAAIAAVGYTFYKRMSK